MTSHAQSRFSHDDKARARRARVYHVLPRARDEHFANIALEHSSRKVRGSRTKELKTSRRDLLTTISFLSIFCEHFERLEHFSRKNFVYLAFRALRLLEANMFDAELF